LELSIAERLSTYIKNVELFISEALSSCARDAQHVIDLARDYLNDAKYYYERGDYATSLSCIAYAEGLLDALRLLGLVKASWRPLSQLAGRPRILVAGSFEFLHPGHIALLKYAWQLGNVHVVVSRDVNFEKFKGRKPIMGERDRLEVISSVKYVSNAVLGDVSDFFKPIIQVKPDIVILGPDQWIEPQRLEDELKRRGLTEIRVLKFPERVGEWSSTSLLAEFKRRLCNESPCSHQST
jgi:FAD synthetase